MRVLNSESLPGSYLFVYFVTPWVETFRLSLTQFTIPIQVSLLWLIILNFLSHAMRRIEAANKYVRSGWTWVNVLYWQLLNPQVARPQLWWPPMRVRVLGITHPPGWELFFCWLFKPISSQGRGSGLFSWWELRPVAAASCSPALRSANGRKILLVFKWRFLTNT